MLPDPAWLSSALAFAVALSATPGPNNTAVAASGARFGIVRTLPHMFGVAFGFPVMLLLVTAGAGELLQGAGWVARLLRVIGVGYILWMAWGIARAPAPSATEAGRQPQGFLAMALFQWANPKAWIIAVSATVTFTDPSARVAQAAALALLFAVVSFGCVLLWTAIGAGAARLLRTERALRRFDLVMAALLAASVLPILFE